VKRRWKMVAEIEIRGFRGIGSGSVPLAPFTVLLGLNGGGKTAVLEALYLAANAGIRKDPVGRVPLRHALRRRGGGDAGGVEVGLEGGGGSRPAGRSPRRPWRSRFGSWKEKGARNEQPVLADPSLPVRGGGLHPPPAGGSP
jgi:hypothetical protein